MFWLLAILAYLLGSLSFAILLSRLAGGPDPRASGSGNPGATNMLRVAGKKLAVMTLIGDLFKGLLPILIAKLLGLSLHQQAWIGLAAVVGHLYPLYFRFRGGKGVATALGVLLGIHWGLGLMAMLTWLIMAYAFRYSSLASLSAALLAPAYYVLWGGTAWYTETPVLLSICAMGALLVYRHRENITRLLKGTESRLGKKAKKPD